MTKEELRFYLVDRFSSSLFAQHITHIINENYIEDVYNWLESNPCITPIEIMNEFFPENKNFRCDTIPIKARLKTDLMDLTVGKVYDVYVGGEESKDDFYFRSDSGIIGHASPDNFEVI